MRPDVGTTVPLVPRPRAEDEGRPEVPAERRLEDCLPFSEDECFECGEPLRWLVISPCPDGCCDRPVCLPCAESLGLEIDEDES